MCFMAYDDSISISPDLTFEKLQESFQNLYEDSLKFLAKNKALKSKYSSLKQKIDLHSKDRSDLKTKNDNLSKELSDFQSQNASLLSEIFVANVKTKCKLAEISVLKSKTEDLMKTILKFTNGKDNLDKLLAYQRVSSYKNSLGYNVLSKPSYPKKNTIFVKISNDYSYASYNYASYNLNSKSNIMYSSIVRSFSGKPKSKWIWVPKTNSSGPKHPWAPTAIT